MREAIRTRLDRPAAAILAITAVGLVLRFAGLGGRVAHFDEGRVAYWTLHFLRTGEFHYRFIIHGPFVQHVNRAVFALIGANDFSMRVIVALIGGLLPLSALLFRRRLRPVETVFLAGFLALNPVLLYYSRFFRSTVPVAAFMFVAFGLFLRAIDTRRAAYAHAGVLFVALGFAAKENAAVYLLVWAGAAVLSLDQTLYRRAPNAWLREYWRGRIRPVVTDRRRLARVAGHLAVGAFLFLAVSVFFYAPRAGAGGGVGLWQALTDPGRFPAVLEATWTDVRIGYEYWFGGASEPGCRKETVIAGYACYLGQFIETMAAYAGALSVLAVLGFIRERYAAGRPRRLVMIAGYWGFVSVLGYPLGTDIYGAWITVNAIVPLAIPAAVGAGRFVGWARDALERDDRIGAGLAAAVLLILGAQTAIGVVGGVYLSPQADGNQLVQYAQPGDNIRPTMREIERLAATNDGLDVLFYGEELVVRNPPAEGVEPTCTDLSTVLPLQWYLATAEAEAGCAINESELDRYLEEDPPPVVIARSGQKAYLADRLEGYTAVTYRLRTSGPRTVFFIDEDRLPPG